MLEVKADSLGGIVAYLLSCVYDLYQCFVREISREASENQ